MAIFSLRAITVMGQDPEKGKERLIMNFPDRETVEFLRSMYPNTAPISVAMLPNITSSMMPPPMRLAIRQPTNSPGIAAEVNIGRMHRASAILTCTGPNDIGAKTSVRTT